MRVISFFSRGCFVIDFSNQYKKEILENFARICNLSTLLDKVSVGDY